MGPAVPPIGPAVPPVPFVTLVDLVLRSADYPACCQDPALLFCGVATILPSALGKQGSIEFPNNIVLKYAGHVGGNKRSFSYLGEEGAEATITCSKDEQCHGHAMNAEGEAFVLEYCGEVGHVWKQLNMEAMREEEPDGEEEEEEEEGDLVGGGRGSSEEENEVLDLTTHVSYSIKFYYTPAFASQTEEIDTFIDNVVTRTNQAYISSRVPLSAFALCKEEAVGLKETGKAKTMVERFAKLKDSRVE